MYIKNLEKAKLCNNCKEKIKSKFNINIICNNNHIFKNNCCTSKDKMEVEFILEDKEEYKIYEIDNINDNKYICRLCERIYK